MKKISNKFHHGAITIIIFPVIIAGVAFKLENIDPNFSCFNPLTMSILAIHRNRLQETVSMLT